MSLPTRLTATLLELCGASAADGLDSVSFAETLRGRPQPERPYQYWEFRPAGAQAVREGPWKLVRTGLKKDQPRLQLFNLVDDPAETTDVLEANPGVAERLGMLMVLAHEPSEGFPLPHVDGPAKEILARKTAP